MAKNCEVKPDRILETGCNPVPYGRGSSPLLHTISPRDEMVDMGGLKLPASNSVLVRIQWRRPNKCPGVGMADIAALEAVAETRESSSLSLGTNIHILIV